MFRIITIAEPVTLFLICDNRHCNYVTTVEAPGFSECLPALQEEAQRQYFSHAKQLGWRIGMDAHICPNCMKSAAETNGRVRLATPHDLKGLATHG